MRINKVFISGLVLFEPVLNGAFHYNMIGFITGKEKPNIAKIYLYGTKAIQFCRNVNTHDLIHIEGHLKSAAIPKRESRKGYIAPIIEVDDYYVLNEQHRQEFIDVDFPRSITKLFADIDITYNPLHPRNGMKMGGNVVG
jgi:hypothetical protein